MAGPTLQEIVKDELRGPVSELVRQIVVELVREQLNGAEPAPVEAPAVNGTAPATRVCKTCGQELPLDRFAPHRHECKQCRNKRYPRSRRARETAAAASETEPPRTGDLQSRLPAGRSDAGPARG
jgi:hypothetical protein